MLASVNNIFVQQLEKMISTKLQHTSVERKHFEYFFFRLMQVIFLLPTKRIIYILFQTEPSPSDTHIQWQLTCLCSQFPNYLQ